MSWVCCSVGSGGLINTYFCGLGDADWLLEQVEWVWVLKNPDPLLSTQSDFHTMECEDLMLWMHVWMRVRVNKRRQAAIEMKPINSLVTVQREPRPSVCDLPCGKS